MKRASQPSKHIIIRAHTDSGSKYADFAIKELSQEWLLLAKQRVNTTRMAAQDKDFYCDSYWDLPVGYYRSPDGRELPGALLEDDEAWAYVVLEPGDLEFKATDLLEAHQLLITANGLASFKAYAKYTGKAYWTDEIQLEELFKDTE